MHWDSHLQASKHDCMSISPDVTSLSGMGQNLIQAMSLSTHTAGAAALSLRDGGKRNNRGRERASTALSCSWRAFHSPLKLETAEM